MSRHGAARLRIERASTGAGPRAATPRAADIAAPVPVETTREASRTWHRNCTHLMQRAIVGAPRVAAAAKEPRSTSHGFSREAIGDRNEGNRRK
jgi:hypothetical protein